MVPWTERGAVLVRWGRRFRRCRWRRGGPAHVLADGAWALAREEARGDVAGFLHTHPEGLPRPSGVDVATMRAWVRCFGKPLLCVIGCGGGERAFRFDGDGFREVSWPTSRSTRGSTGAKRRWRGSRGRSS